MYIVYCILYIVYLRMDSHCKAIRSLNKYKLLIADIEKILNFN